MCVPLGAGGWAPKRAKSQRVKIQNKSRPISWLWKLCGRASGWLTWCSCLKATWLVLWRQERCTHLCCVLSQNKKVLCVCVFRNLFKSHILYRGTEKMLQDDFLLLRLWISKQFFFFSNRSLHRFHPLDHRRAEATRTSFENVPSKYSGKVGKDSWSSSWQDEEGLHEAVQGVSFKLPFA